ncbi:hypothetical protein OROGR_011012 [Orobanche gracilis]
MEVDKGVKLEKTASKGFEYGGLKQKIEYQGCIRCLELYDRITKANNKCLLLELDIDKKKSVIGSLEGKLGLMELKNLKIENEVRMLKQRNEELENSIRNHKEEDDKLMIENKVLECEKTKAEIDMDAWKVKCIELEMKVMELEKRLSAGMMKSGTHPINIPSNHFKEFEGFKGEGSPRNNISPSTPGIRPPFIPIEISDNDDDDDVNLNVKKFESSSGAGSRVGLDAKEVNSKDSEEVKNVCHIVSPPYHPLPKAKRMKIRSGVAYAVTIESESDSGGDNIPIGSLRSKKPPVHSSDARRNESGSRNKRKKCTHRRRLKRMGEHGARIFSGKPCNKSTENKKEVETYEVLNDYLSADEMEEDDSCSEGESLDGFIVDSSDISESDSHNNDGASSGDCSGDSKNESETSMGYDRVISGLRRERKRKISWDYEADMLADLCKFPELCMRGVCAIYRRQTTDEKSCQATMYRNGRGFSQSHASIGSDLAEFLTDGDPHGDVTKSVEELQEFYPEGVKECKKLAIHYSRQLYEIYKNREDPFFHP